MDNKEQQRRLLTEVMNADAKDGLYEPQTAVEWLAKKLEDFNGKDNPWFDIPQALLEQAKAMEKEQLNTARIDGINLANKGYGK